MNKFTRPGFFLCPRKPYPKGNAYHTICCGESGIMYGWEIVERRYNLIPMGQPEFETSTNMKTVGLMRRLTRALWSTGKAVIMDSVFCVLKGLLEMRKRGVCGSALIKKRCYWPKGVHEDDIGDYFRSKYW